jgi:hypothetical protein
MAETTVIGPVHGGSRGRPFGRPLVDLDGYGFVEQEWFLEGEAVRYRSEGVLAPDGRWSASPAGTARFRTRFVVYRPAAPDAFNGTVVVSWNNVSAGYELFGGESPEILEGGYAFVGVTTQRVAIEGLPPLPQGLAAWDPERYGSLSHPGDDYSYDIFTAAARALGPQRPRQGVDPMGGLEVRHLIALGSSQSAGRLATYVNAIHPLTSAFDGYLLGIWFGAGSPLEVGDEVIDLNKIDAQQDRGVSGLLRGSHRLRDDLDVPVMVVNSELEAIACRWLDLPDTDRFRYWEVAGASHVSVQSMAIRAPKYERDFGTQLPVLPGMNAVPLQPVYDAALHHLHHWLNGGPPPPIQPRIEFAGEPPVIVRDADGIAQGGIRLPYVEVPVARNSMEPLGDDLFSLLYGSSHPFPAEQVAARYGDRSTFLARYTEAAQAAERAGVLLPRDVEALVEEAAAAYPG